MTGKVANFANYPNGFAGGLMLKDHPVVQNDTGKVFWVAEGANGTVAAFPNTKSPSDGNKGTFLAPFKSVDYAVGQCLADRGDTIYVKPGYAENVGGAAGVDLDVDGITLIGLGQGDKQPKFSFDTTSDTVELNADNVTVRGFNFEAAVAAAVVGLNIVDGADDYHVADCRFTAATVGTHSFNDAMSVTTADRGVIERNYFDQDEVGTTQSAIHLVGAILGCTIRNNYVTGDYAVACIEHITTAAEQILIDGNTLINGVHGGLNTLECIELLTGTTGVIQNNTLYTNTAAGAAIVSDATFRLNNYHATTADSAPVLMDAETGGWQTVDNTSNPIGVNDADNAYDSSTVAANRDGSVLERLEDVRDLQEAGEAFWVTKTLTSSAILTGGVDVTGVSSGGVLTLDEVIATTDATGLAAGTNFTIETNNASGATAGWGETVANLGATKHVSVGSVFNEKQAIESGKKLVAKCTVGSCTGTGVLTLYLKFIPHTAGATIAAA
jgi:hypothetical protein